MTSPGLRLASIVRALLRPLLGSERASQLAGYIYAVLTLVTVSFQEQHRRALLGLLWMLITPTLFLAVYLPVFSGFVSPDASERLGGPYGFSIYVVIGLITWTAFVEGFQGGAASLVSNPGLVQHSPIPLTMLPLVKVVGAMIGLCLGCTLVLALLTLLGRFPGVRLLLLPVAIGLLSLFVLGLAQLASAMALLFRDLLQIISTLLMIEFFAIPIVYLPEAVGGTFQRVVALNPLTPFLRLVRAALLPSVSVELQDVGLAVAWASAAYLVGATVFRRMAASMADHT